AGSILSAMSARAVVLAWSERLRTTALQLMVLGALAAVCSRVTGDSEADRLWDAMSPAAQAILLSDAGSANWLSHAVLGSYLAWVFGALALWRVLQEASTVVLRIRVAYLLVAAVALGALLYQGKTGGELVYEQGVGTPSTNSATSRAR